MTSLSRLIDRCLKRELTDSPRLDLANLEVVNSDRELADLEMIGLLAKDPQTSQVVLVNLPVSPAQVEAQTTLSQREQEILQLVAKGYTNHQIGRCLVISANTVKVHLRHIFEKMKVQCRTEAAMVAVERGWVVLS